MTAAVQRRPFDAVRDARRFVFLLDEPRGRLWEVIGVRGVPARAAPDDRRPAPAPNAALKLLDVGRDLPTDPFEALDCGEWVTLQEAERLVVVQPVCEDAA